MPRSTKQKRNRYTGRFSKPKWRTVTLWGVWFDAPGYDYWLRSLADGRWSIAGWLKRARASEVAKSQERHVQARVRRLCTVKERA